MAPWGGLKAWWSVPSLHMLGSTTWAKNSGLHGAPVSLPLVWDRLARTHSDVLCVPSFTTSGERVALCSDSTHRDFLEGHPCGCWCSGCVELLGKGCLGGWTPALGVTAGPLLDLDVLDGVLPLLSSGHKIIGNKITFVPRCVLPTGGFLFHPHSPLQKSLTCPVQIKWVMICPWRLYYG